MPSTDALSGPYRRGRLRRVLLPAAHVYLRARARGPRLGRYEPRSTLILDEHRPDRARYAAVDFHTHLGRWLTADGSWMEPDVERLVAFMDGCNVAAMVNLDGRWGDELLANLERYDFAYPGRFLTFCHLDWSVLDRPSGIAELVRSLKDSVRAGARGLKVWKDLGLSVTARGGLVMPDDPMLAPIWETAGELSVPVLVHTADPVAFFDPVDRRNERLEELLRHPPRSLADAGRATFTRLIDSFEALVANNPGTRFVGAHVGCYPENLGWVSRMLDQYPNLWIDTSARAMDLGRQPRAAATLIERQADRVLFGTDSFPIRHSEYCLYFRLLESSDESFAYSQDPEARPARWTISGLALNDDALERVYAKNASDLLGCTRPL